MKTADNTLSFDEINELDERRLEMLDEAGIDERDVLDSTRKDTDLWNAYFNENITRGKDDMEFTIREQWKPEERSEFTRLFKPPLTCNKLYDSTKKVAAEQRENKPDLQVRSLTGKATEEQIKLRSDLVRTISYQSQNDLVYQNAFMSALLRGYGTYEIAIEYETPRSFNKVLRYKLINNPVRCAFDPTALMPHKGDGNFYSREYVFSGDEFAATYPFIINPVSYSDPRTLVDFQWQAQNIVVVCDRYVKEWYPLIIYKLSNGLSVTKEEWEDLQEQFAKRKEMARDAIVVGGIILNEIPKIIAERQSQDYRIMQYHLLQNQIIDFAEWPSKYLPGVFVDGDSHYIDGMQYTKSFVHEAKDMQKFLNYTVSEIAAEIKNRRREQWMGTPDNIVGNEQMWRNPEMQNGILIAKPDPKTGAMPIKMNAWEISEGLSSQAQRANMDIKEILGFFEANAGQTSNEVSGKAIRERKMGGNMSSYVFRDNLNQAIEQGGRIVLDLLPTIYGGDERSMIVSKADGKTQSLILNQKMPDGSIKNELTKGEYDVEISAGPSFAVQKETAMEFMIDLVKVRPDTFNLVADYIAQNMDVEFMPQIAERFKTLVPPQIIAQEEGKPMPPPQPNPEEQAMQIKMKLDEQQLMERAEELRMRGERHELEKAELMMKAKEMQEKMNMSKVNNQVQLHKTDLDYSAKIAKVLADFHHKSMK
jgi:hypothetical protein